MDEDQWMYDSIMSEEVDMNERNEDDAGVNEEHVTLLPCDMSCIVIDTNLGF